MKNRLLEIPFTNHIGQTINVGDDVIAVGTSWGTTRVMRGTFAGVYEGESAVQVKDIPYQKWNWNPAVGKGFYSPSCRKSVLPLKRVYKIAA